MGDRLAEETRELGAEQLARVNTLKVLYLGEETSVDVVRPIVRASR